VAVAYVPRRAALKCVERQLAACRGEIQRVKWRNAALVAAAVMSACCCSADAVAPASPGPDEPPAWQPNRRCPERSARIRSPTTSLVLQVPLLSRPLSPAQPAPRLLSRSPPVQPQAGSYWLPCYLTLLAQLVRLHSVADDRPGRIRGMCRLGFAVICSAGAATQACDEDDHSP
jgi:hypothetical protein